MSDSKHAALADRLLRSNAELVTEYESDARQSAKGLRTGFKTVCVGDFNRGEEFELIIPRKAITFFTGKSGGGKTTGMMNMAWRLIQNGYKGAFITLEEPAVDIFSKMMSIYSASVANKKTTFRDGESFFDCKTALGKGFKTWQHAQGVQEKMSEQFKIFDATKYIDDPSIYSPTLLQDPEFLEEFLRHASDVGAKYDFIMIDYVQLMDTGQSGISEAKMMKNVANALRRIIGSNPQTALILGAQLQREVAFKDFEEWQKENISDGSNLEKAANLVLAFAMKTVNDKPYMAMKGMKFRGGNPMFQSLHECWMPCYYMKGTGTHDPDAMG